MGVVQWAEKPLLKGTVSPSFERCAIAADSLEKKAGNKPTPPRAISISETELRAASQAKRLKHKQHQKPEPPLHKSKAKSFFSRGRVGLPRQCWPFTTVIRNMSCWCKGQQRAELVSTLVRRVFPDWRHLIGCWWVTVAEVHTQRPLIGCYYFSIPSHQVCGEWFGGSKSYHLNQLIWWEWVREATFSHIAIIITILAASFPGFLLEDAFLKKGVR